VVARVATVRGGCAGDWRLGARSDRWAGRVVVSIVLVHHVAMFVETLGAALGQRGHIVLGSTTALGDGLAATLRLRPDVCLMDDSFPGREGLAAVRQICRSTARSRVLVLAGRLSSQDVAVLRRAGADGLILGSASIDDVSQGATRVARGHGVWPTAQPLRGCAGFTSLTPREREVLDLVAAGARTADIATALDISVNTARTHVQRVLAKLGVSNRFQAASLLRAESGGATERSRIA
jgi:two-component system, NarL family, nitrate/nitrite response regulator NarL